MILLAASLLMGLAVAIAAWAGREWIEREVPARSGMDARNGYLRFQPEPINAPGVRAGLLRGLCRLAGGCCGLIIPSLAGGPLIWLALAVPAADVHRVAVEAAPGEDRPADSADDRHAGQLHARRA
jgi:hypothetical protein